MCPSGDVFTSIWKEPVVTTSFATEGQCMCSHLVSCLLPGAWDISCRVTLVQGKMGTHVLCGCLGRSSGAPTQVKLARWISTRCHGFGCEKDCGFHSRNLSIYCGESSLFMGPECKSGNCTTSVPSSRTHRCKPVISTRWFLEPSVAKMRGNERVSFSKTTTFKRIGCAGVR